MSGCDVLSHVISNWIHTEPSNVVIVENVIDQVKGFCDIVRIVLGTTNCEEECGTAILMYHVTLSSKPVLFASAHGLKHGTKVPLEVFVRRLYFV